MSDVDIGIKTNLDSEGTQQLGKDLDAAKLMTESLTKATEEQNRAAALATDTTEKKSDAEKESADSMRNLQGVGQQLNGALNGNISAMTKSIQVSPQFAASLQQAFSVLGAATFGYGVGSAIFKSIIEPSLEANSALKDLSTVTNEYGATLDKAEFDNYAATTKQITESYKAQSDALKDNEARMERAFGWAKKLLDVSYEVEELRIKALPAGRERDIAMAGLQERKGKDESALQVEQAQASMRAAGQEVVLADANYNRALNIRDQKIQAAKGKLSGIEDEAGLRYSDAQGQASSQGAWWNAVKGMFTGGANLGLSGAFGASSDRASELRKQIHGLETGDELKALEEGKKRAEKKFWEARESARYTEQVASQKTTAIDLKKDNEITGINQEDAARRAKEKADADKRALEDEKRRLDDERRETKDKLTISDRRGLPEQVRAQRESAEAQSAGGTRNYQKELAEAKEAEKRATEVISTLNATLIKLNERYKQVEERIRNLPVQ